MIQSVHIHNKESTSTSQQGIAEKAFRQQQEHDIHEKAHEHEHKKVKKIVKKKKKEVITVEEKQGRKNESIFLFSIDAIAPNGKITSEMEHFMLNLRKKMHVAVISGSSLIQQKDRLGAHVLNEWDYVFSENGLVTHKDGQHLATQTLVEKLGEEKLKPFINFSLRYIADLDIPMKRGTFLELRNGTINISPIGRNSTQKEREHFEEYDKKNNIRSQFVTALKSEFKSYELVYSMPDGISFDVTPQGWDKSYCLQHLISDKYKTIHFFGEKPTNELDSEILSSKHVVGHLVTSPDDMMKQVSEVLQ